MDPLFHIPADNITVSYDKNSRRIVIDQDGQATVLALHSVGAMHMALEYAERYAQEQG